MPEPTPTLPAAEPEVTGLQEVFRRSRGPVPAGLLSGMRQNAKRRGATSGEDTAFATEDPLGLFLALEASDQFRRDTPLGGIFHHGKISFREICRTDSLHITIDRNRVTAHVDTVSPLDCQPDGTARYSIPAILAHNLVGIRSDFWRRLRGRHGEQRCDLECDMVWVDEAPDVGAGEVEAADRGVVDEPPLLEGGSALGKPAPVPDRIPFGLIDEAVHLLDTEAAPWSVQLEVRVDGHFDEPLVRASLAKALASHPMARVRKIASRRSHHGDDWEIPAALDIDPLRIVECADDAALDAARAELQSLAVPLAESPPLRLRLARHPDGDVLMLNVNHAAMDGFGALRVMRSLASAYSGDADPVPELDFMEARALPVRLASTDATTRFRRYLALAEKLRDLVAPPARLCGDGASDEAGYGFHHVSLSTDETQGLIAQKHRGTVNDLLLASLHLAIAGWNGEHGERCGRIGVLIPANLRPQQWREEMVGNFSLPARISTGSRARRDRWSALEAVTRQTRRKKARGPGTALIEVLRRSPMFPMWVKQVLVMMLPLSGNRLVDTAMLSNLGSVDAPSFGSVGSATEVWFSPPARMPLGLAIGVVTSGGRMHLAFRYRHRLFDAGAARRFAERYLDEVRGFIEGN